jgi:NTF2 fold immunity protein of polymorphic toxin system component
MKIFWVCYCMLLIATLAIAQGFKPKEAYVPDSTTAVKVAEAVLIPVYGKRQIESEEPFNATLKDGVWIVRGTLPCPDPKTSCIGGVAEVKISKDDARILSMIHYK